MTLRMGQSAEPKGEWRLSRTNTRFTGQNLTKLWVVGLIGFTGLLCAPGDWLPDWIGGSGLSGGMGWGKVGHVAGYATLAGLACALPISERLRLGALVVL